VRAASTIWEISKPPVNFYQTTRRNNPEDSQSSFEPVLRRYALLGRATGYLKVLVVLFSLSRLMPGKHPEISHGSIPPLTIHNHLPISFASVQVLQLIK
jgi:hypothetical protein